MTLPDYIGITQGTAVVFGESTASGVTNALTFQGLANGAARMSEVADLGQDYSDEYLVYMRAETNSGTAPTAGNTLDLYLVGSHDNTNFPGFCTGSDAAYPPTASTTATLDQALRQLGTPVLVLAATPDADKVQVQAPVIWRPRGRYVVAVVDNNLGQAIKTEATAANNDSRVILVPRRVEVNDT